MKVRQVVIRNRFVSHISHFIDDERALSRLDRKRPWKVMADCGHFLAVEAHCATKWSAEHRLQHLETRA